MTIKSLDAQILLPKSNEIAKQVNNNRQHQPNSQQLLTQEIKRHQAEDRGKVSQTNKSEHKKVKEEEKEEKRRRDGKTGAKESKKTDDNHKGESSKTADNFKLSLGHRVDIKI